MSGLIQSLADSLGPHADKLNATIGLHARGINNKLHAIEQAVSDLGRGDIGDNWQRFQIKKKFAGAETLEIGICPTNEIWLIQYIASDGVQEKTPEFILEANGLLIATVGKEATIPISIGGNQAVLTGETLNITSRAAGNINCTVSIIRRKMPTQAIVAQMGRDADRESVRSTHDPNRDVVISPTDTFSESIGSLVPTEGRQG